MQNHVYRNGALLDGYALSADWLRRWRPEIVLERLPAPVPHRCGLLRAGRSMGNGVPIFIAERWRWAMMKFISTSIAGAVGSGRIALISSSPGRSRSRRPSATPAARSDARRAIGRTSRLARHCGGSICRRASRGELRTQHHAAWAVPPATVRGRTYGRGRPFGQVAEARVTVGGATF